MSDARAGTQPPEKPILFTFRWHGKLMTVKVPPLFKVRRGN